MPEEENNKKIGDELVFEEERDLVRWVGLERPFKHRPKEFFNTVLVLALLVSIIFFFIEGLMPVLVIAAVTFMIWVLYKTEPGPTEYVITNHGVMTGKSRYLWDELVCFWFEDKWGSVVLNIQTLRPMPGVVMMVLPQSGDKSGVDQEGLKKLLLKYLPMERPPESWTDKAVTWVGKKVPLES